jgi:hypothetical protein
MPGFFYWCWIGKMIRSWNVERARREFKVDGRSVRFGGIS